MRALYEEQSARPRKQAELWHPDRLRPLYAEFFRKVRLQSRPPFVPKKEVGENAVELVPANGHSVIGGSVLVQPSAAPAGPLAVERRASSVTMDALWRDVPDSACRLLVVRPARSLAAAALGVLAFRYFERDNDSVPPWRLIAEKPLYQRSRRVSLVRCRRLRRDSARRGSQTRGRSHNLAQLPARTCWLPAASSHWQGENTTFTIHFLTTEIRGKHEKNAN